jgi:hypothetical protein
MTDTIGTTDSDISGWFELDHQGTVLYCRPVNGNGLGASEPRLVGKDFFGDVLATHDSGPLRRHFRRFLTSDRPVESFFFDCLHNNETIKTKVCMTRGHESDSDRTAGIIILDIKKATAGI